MNYVGVLPDKFRNGIGSLNGPHINKRGEYFKPEAQKRCTIEEALTTHWPSDAHCTCYWIEGEPQIPLLKKEILPELKAAGKDVVTTAIMLDWDTPEHVPLTQDLLIVFISGLYKATQEHPELDEWFCWYTSKNGARLVYSLKEPVPVRDAERYTASLTEMFKESGMEFDENCRDWTRRFRLPYVIRDGEDSSSYCIYQPKGHVLDLSTIKKAPKGKLVFHKKFERKAYYPTQEECAKRLTTVNPSTGRAKQSNFVNKAKKVLKGSDWYEVLFQEDVDFCVDSGRNEMLQQLLGYIVPKLIRGANATAEDIFALVYGPLCQWEPLPNKIHPHEHCWNFLQDIYEREIAIYNNDKDREAEAASVAEALLDDMAQGMRAWDDHPDLESENPDVRHEYVKHRIFATVESYYFPLLPNGTYSKEKLRPSHIIPYIETGPLSPVIDVKKPDIQGNLVYLATDTIIKSCSVIAQKCSFRPQLEPGGYIKGIGSQRSELVLPMYRRNPLLTPQYNEHVDGWLKALFGNHYEDCCKWIGYALAFEEGPICALSLQGEGGTGKKLLTLGLAECLENGIIADADAVSGNSQGQLMETPFFVVNEAWPKNGKMSPADQFKRYTSGDPLPISEKFMPNTQCTNPLRVIFTANGHDLVYALTEGRTISPADREAIGERLYHVNVGIDAKNYLRAIGGPGFTAKEGARWIRGDADQPSDYIVARHFLWLYQNRPARDTSERYCMMGNCGSSSKTSHRMMVRSLSVALVIKAIIGMAEKQQANQKHLFFDKMKGRFLVTEAGISKYLTEVMNERISDREVSDGLQNVTMNSQPEMIDYKYFYEVDCESILTFAAERGIDAPGIRGVKEFIDRLKLTIKENENQKETE